VFTRLLAQILVLLTWLSAAGPLAYAAGQTQGAPSPPLGGAWRPVPGGLRASAILAGTQLIVYDGTPAGWDRYDLASNAWHRISELGAPDAPSSAIAAWTGTALLVWSGSSSAVGSRYDPATDTWRPMSAVGAPSSPRTEAASVWTGRELLVWGGSSSAYSGDLGDGAAYDPAANRWRPMATQGAPSARERAIVVWTGHEMLVLGGHGRQGTNVPANVAYDPARDAWREIAWEPRLVAGGPVVAWTGSEMLVWSINADRSAPGLRYDPASDTWREIPSPPDSGRLIGATTGVWTGHELLVVADAQFVDGLKSVVRYDPGANVGHATLSARA
jgi:hypothetical protein